MGPPKFDEGPTPPNDGGIFSPRCGTSTNLERHFNGELDLSRRKRATDCSESGTGNIRIRSLKIRVIEYIEELGAKFEARFFGNRQFELFMHA